MLATAPEPRPTAQWRPERLTTPEWIYRELRQRIVAGDLDGGTPLRQQHLAQQFGVSSIPVREALRMLEADGLVAIARNRGAVVCSVSLADALEIIDLRLALEPLAIAQAVPHMNRAYLRETRSILREYDQIEVPGESVALNRRFHRALYERCGSPRLLKMIDSLFDDVLRLAHLEITARVGRHKARREHARILRACESGDAGKAAQLLRDHIARSRGSLVELLDRENDLNGDPLAIGSDPESSQ